MTDPLALGFTGATIDRAAHLRRDSAALAARADARVLVMRDGQPLIADDALSWCAPGDPVAAAGGDSIFLGLEGAAPRFATLLPGDAPDPTDGRVFADLRAALAALPSSDAAAAATARALGLWHARHGHCSACGAATRPAEAGWQRDCPDCGARHFPRTDPVVIMLVTDGDEVLLGRSPDWPDGMYSLLAGFVEPGETLGQAVRREVAEETGILVGQARFIASQPWPFPASLMVGFRARALSRDITIDPVEIADALWVSKTRAMRALAGRDPVLRPPRRGAMAAVLLRDWLAGRIE